MNPITFGAAVAGAALALALLIMAIQTVVTAVSGNPEIILALLAFVGLAAMAVRFRP